MSKETPAIRYFSKRNPARPLEVGDQLIKFEICDYLAGAYRGVYKDVDGTIPDSAIHSAENKAGKVTEVTEQEYLTILQKKRANPNSTATSVEGSKPQPPKSDAASAEKADEVDDVDPSKIDEVASIDDPKEKSRVTSYKALAEVTGVAEDTLKEYNKREDSPTRLTSGFVVAEWIEYLAANHTKQD